LVNTKEQKGLREVEIQELITQRNDLQATIGTK